MFDSLASILSTELTVAGDPRRDYLKLELVRCTYDQMSIPLLPTEGWRNA